MRTFRLSAASLQPARMVPHQVRHLLPMAALDPQSAIPSQLSLDTDFAQPFVVVTLLLSHVTPPEAARRRLLDYLDFHARTPLSYGGQLPSLIIEHLPAEVWQSAFATLLQRVAKDLRPRFMMDLH
jgi:hypothetical protein